MTEFDVLRAARKEVREFTRRHAPSVNAFYVEGRDWFKINLRENDSTQYARHKTTTATCIESLADLEASKPDDRHRLRELATMFARNALAQSAGKWQSEGAAFVYCRVRTLPAILAYADADAVAEKSKKIAEHLGFVWGEVSEQPRRQGVYERPTLGSDAGTLDESPTYPPNAFHTFWAMRTLALARRKEVLKVEADKYASQLEIASLWTQNVLASQIALYHAKSDRADPHQLAWALAAEFVDSRQGDEATAGELSRAEIHKAALAAFFGQQLENGSWGLGQPLFHYPKAGNAYCYTYETLAELLRPALHASTGRPYRDLLRPHLPELLKAWGYLRATTIPLNAEGTAVGWSSGHHPHRVYAEGWATAVAFSFVQCLRRLLGIWTREEAARALGVRPPKYESRQQALAELAGRGETWTGGKRWSAGQQLCALFLHPILAKAPQRDHQDPDLALVDENQARSAILFGPPGTSKTTLVESLAGAVGWDFVEVHASHFLSEGMNQVPARADEIFSSLMELDHCVILFDEIDELLRRRTDERADPFGRFLTTSMLPKLATLWAQRRVLFFVATNDITKADDAITRSQRFDAAIFVAPPSFRVKAAKFAERFPGKKLPFDEEAVEHDLVGDNPKDNPLGFFAMLRYDQIDEFADLVRDDPSSHPMAKEALRKIGSRMDGADDAYRQFRDLEQEERRDHRSVRLLWVGSDVPPSDSGLEVFERDGSGEYMRIIAFEDCPPEDLLVDGKTARDIGALRYVVNDGA